MALLKQFKTAFGSIRVTRDRDGTLAYFQNGCFHSQANARGVSVCAYVHVIYQLICQKKLRKVLIIGCGGGTLATMLSRVGIQVTIVDINPVAFTIARDYFRMPDSVICVVQNGLTFVKKTKQRFDAVIIDVFDRDNNVQKGFTTKAFLASAKKTLRRSGILIMNVITKNARDHRADAIAKRVDAAGMKANIYEWSKEKDSNTIIVGGLVRGVLLPSGREPTFVKKELKTVLIRKPK